MAAGSPTVTTVQTAWLVGKFGLKLAEIGTTELGRPSVWLRRAVRETTHTGGALTL